MGAELRTAANFTKDQKKILKVMWRIDALSASVSTTELSIRTRMTPRQIGQILSNMPFEVDKIKGPRGTTEWKLKNCNAGLL